MTGEEEALLLAVVAAPDDDLPRLVAADWYEENGRQERAEFIRLQVAAGERRRRLRNNRHPYRQGCRCGACSLEKKASAVFHSASENDKSLAWVHPEARAWITACGFDRGFPSRPHTRMSYWLKGTCCGCNGGRGILSPHLKANCRVCRGSPNRTGAGYAIATFMPVTHVVFSEKQPDRDPSNLRTHPPVARDRWFWHQPDGAALTERVSRAVVSERMFAALGEVDPPPESALHYSFGHAYYMSVWDANSALSAAALHVVSVRARAADRKPTISELA